VPFNEQFPPGEKRQQDFVYDFKLWAGVKLDAGPVILPEDYDDEDLCLFMFRSTPNI